MLAADIQGFRGVAECCAFSALAKVDVDGSELASDRLEHPVPRIDRLRDVAGKRQAKVGHDVLPSGTQVGMIADVGLTRARVLCLANAELTAIADAVIDNEKWRICVPATAAL